MRSKKKMTFDTVRRIGLTLPGVEEGTSWGTPALKVGGKMFACVPNHKSAEAGSLAIRLDMSQRDEMIAEDPDTYYLPDHYVNYPCVLVRLAHVDEDMLKDLLGVAYRFMSARNKRTTPRRKR